MPIVWMCRQIEFRWTSSEATLLNWVAELGDWIPFPFFSTQLKLRCADKSRRCGSIRNEDVLDGCVWFVCVLWFRWKNFQQSLRTWSFVLFQGFVSWTAERSRSCQLMSAVETWMLCSSRTKFWQTWGVKHKTTAFTRTRKARTKETASKDSWFLAFGIAKFDWRCDHCQIKNLSNWGVLDAPRAGLILSRITWNAAFVGDT